MARRIWYAEDIALAFEMNESGKAWDEVSAHFGVTHSTMRSMILRARRSGFDAYPKRDK